MKLFIFPIFYLLSCSFTHAQSRLFFDVPSVAFVAPDVAHIGNQLGLNLETAFNIGSHWSVARIGGGVNATVDPKSKQLEETFDAKPYFMTEVGLGKYRTNGNHCSRTNQNAFTAMIKGGLRYAFSTKKITPASELDRIGLDYTLGVELGYFRIRDVFKNSEVVLASNYHLNAKVVSVSLGYKLFLNLRAER
jgi:hypothetical protein